MHLKKIASGLVIGVLFWVSATLTLTLPTGCSSLNKGSYQATGVASVTVDKAMIAWGDYVARFHPGPAAEAKVKAAYESYQQSVNTVADTAMAYLKAKAANDPNTPALQAAFNNAISAAGAALADLENLIVSFGVKLT